MKNDILNRDHISLMVNTFYSEVKKDDLLGPIFFQIIGNEWEPHLEKMVNFWDSLLFHQPVYNGNPYPKHADLPIQTMHFERWLSLFNTCLNQNFEGPNTARASELGANVANVFMAKMFGNLSELNIV